ncbi:MAG TPA: rod shape-determining protein MreC [Clostridiaceae bacterium]|nr:rod shape-determining protein MreC [Clostridiaceae bacterium]
MPHFFKKKIFILTIITIILIALIIVSYNNIQSMNWLNNIISVPLTPIQNAFSFLGKKIEEGITFFNDVKEIRKENEELKILVAELQLENRELTGYREKVNELREALKLKDQFNDYDIIGANIIAKDPGNWFNIFKIDVGKRDNVTEDMPVITSGKSLVGRIMSADFTSSKVISIIDEDSVVSAKLAKPGGGHVIIRGDVTLKDKGYCRMDYIPLDADVAVGDIVETSGLGGIYPKGILIGSVIEVKKSASELSRYAIVKPEVDFKKLDEVFVLINKNVNEAGNTDNEN